MNFVFPFLSLKVKHCSAVNKLKLSPPPHRFFIWNIIRSKPKLLMPTTAVWCYRFVLLFGFVLFYLLVAIIWNIVICTIPHKKVDTRIINHNYIVLWCNKCINNNTDASIERLIKFTFFTVLIKVDFQALTAFVWLLVGLRVKSDV